MQPVEAHSMRKNFLRTFSFLGFAYALDVCGSRQLDLIVVRLDHEFERESNFTPRLSKARFSFKLRTGNAEIGQDDCVRQGVGLSRGMGGNTRQCDAYPQCAPDQGLLYLGGI